MKNILVLTLALAATMLVSACQTPQPQPGTPAGGATGGDTGAQIGNAATTPTGRCAQWAYDYNGNKRCTALY